MKNKTPLTLTEQWTKGQTPPSENGFSERPGESRLFEGQLVWRLCFIVVVVTSVLGALSFISVRRFHLAAKAVSGSERALILIADLGADVAGIDRFATWFIQTGADALVPSYDRMLRRKDLDIATLRQVDSKGGQPSIDQLNVSIDRWCAETSRIMQLRKTQGIDLVAKPVPGNDQLRLVESLEQIQGGLDAMRTRETDQLKTLSFAATKARHRCYGIVLGSALGYGVLLGGILLLLQTKHCKRDEEPLIRQLLDYIPDALFVKDDQGRYTFGNRALRKFLTGNEKAAIEGKTVFDFLTPRAAEVHDLDERAIIRSKTPVVDRVEKRTDGDGQEHWFLTTKAPICNAQGEFTALIGIQRDIPSPREEWDETAQTSKPETVAESDYIGASDNESDALTPQDALLMTGRKLLVVGHSPDSQSSLEAILCGWKLNVKFANGPTEAMAEVWEAFQGGKPFDLLLINALLSQMSGFELARIIKKEAELKETSLILLYSKADAGSLENATDAGFEGTLSTPMCSRELLDALRQAWSEHRSRPAPLAFSFEPKENKPAPVPAVPLSEARSDTVVYSKDQLLSNYGDEELLTKLVGLFLDQLPQLIADMDAAIETKNFELLGRAAHALKGSVGNFGAKNARQMAESLQSAALKEDLTAAVTTAADLKAELERVIEGLRTCQ